MAHEASTPGHGGNPLRRLLPAPTTRIQTGSSSPQAPSAESELSELSSRRRSIKAACNACHARKSKARDNMLEYSMLLSLLLTVECVYSVAESDQSARLASPETLLASITLPRTRRTPTPSNESTTSYSTERHLMKSYMSCFKLVRRRKPLKSTSAYEQAMMRGFF